MKEEKSKLQVQYDELKMNLDLASHELEKIKNENKILKIEANNAFILMDQNEELKKQLNSIKLMAIPQNNNDQEYNNFKVNE